MGWLRVDEPLFGEYGDAKLNVSVSFGSSAVLKWMRQSCPDGEETCPDIGHHMFLRGIMVMEVCPLQELVSRPVLVEMSLEKRLKLVNCCKP